MKRVAVLLLWAVWVPLRAQPWADPKPGDVECTYNIPDPRLTGDSVLAREVCTPELLAQVKREVPFSQWEDDQDRWGFNAGCSATTVFGRTVNAFLVLKLFAPDVYTFVLNRLDEVNPRCWKDDEVGKNVYATNFDGVLQDDRVELYIPFYETDVVDRAQILAHESRHSDSNDPSHWNCKKSEEDGSQPTDRYYVRSGIDRNTGAYSIGLRTSLALAYGARGLPATQRLRALNMARGMLGSRFCTYAAETFPDIEELGARPPLTRLSAGNGYTAYINASYQLFTWGADTYGTLGNGATTGSQSTPAQVSSVGTLFRQVSSGADHVCARGSDPTAAYLMCWGSNAFGRLNVPAGADTTAPVMLGNLSDAASVVAGGPHTCAALFDTRVACWGRNEAGELGDGTTTDRGVPTPVTGLFNVSQVVAGVRHTCGLDFVGNVLCWGGNNYGQLGDGTTTGRTAPVRVNLPNVRWLAGGFGHNCAVDKDGAVFCWGWNGSGQLGRGAGGDSATPARVPLTVPARMVTAGDQHSCAITTDGNVSCWGRNDQGQLGDGTRTNRLAPVQVGGISNVVDLTAGDQHTCAQDSSGALWCWGLNTSGQLGDGTFTSTTAPVRVLGF